MDQASKCDNHPDRQAQQPCSQCARNLCSECLRVRDGVFYCTECFPKGVPRAEPSSDLGSVLRTIGIVILVLAVVSIVAMAVLFGLLYMVCGKR